jgi:hypothetical protein
MGSRSALLGVSAAVFAAGCATQASEPSSAARTARSGAASSGAQTSAGGAVRDWPRFGYDAARSGASPGATGITPASVGTLRRHVIDVPGTVDSSPIFLHSIVVHGHRRDVFVVTTSYGKTLALDAAGGQRLWQYVPPSAARVTGTAQITNASPVSDPDRRYVYAASPDGRIRKLRLSDGREVRHGHWPAVITRDATHEKIAAALNLAGGNVYAVTGGYVGDAPPYQGHVVAIGRRDGRIVAVFNSLCSNRRRIIVPSSCASSDSAIWARAGAVIEPRTRRLLVTTGNGPFNGRTDWGDSVLELSTRSLRLLQSYTPRSQASLEATDADLGSTAPALLPAPGGSATPRYAVQGGKDGIVRLLSLRHLNNRRRPARGVKGGELQVLHGREIRYSAPAVLRRAGHLFLFTASGNGTEAYELRGRPSRLHLLWSNGNSGSSPVLAGGLLYVYDVESGGLNVYRPESSHPLITLPAGSGHWNSPVIGNRRILLPEGSANSHSASGVLDLYAP